MTPPNTAGRIETHDSIEYQEASDLFDVNFRQITPEAFHCLVEYVQVNGIFFYREHWTPRVMATGATPKGYFIFGGSLSSAPEKSVDWCGAKVNRKQIVFGRSASEMEIIFPHDTTHLALLIPYHLIKHYFGEELLTYALTSKLQHLKCNSHYGFNLIARLDYMISKYQANPTLLTDALECKAVELQLIDALADYFDSVHTTTASLPSTQRRKLLHRAINFGDTLREAITVPEFVMASGMMSQCSLELAFKESLGITPRQYLYRHRMYSVHRELLDSDAVSTTITKVATYWGFTELGRFAIDYKQFYAESPSI